MTSRMGTPPGLFGPKHIRIVVAGCQLMTVRNGPCGRLLVGGGCDGKVHIWDLAAEGTPELSPLSGHDGWVQALAFHRDGDRLFTADSWGRICCWTYPPPSQLLWEVRTAHDGWVRELAISPDGSTLASCGADRCVRLWKADDGRLQHALPHAHDVYCVAFHPSGKDLVSGDLNGVVRHWELAARRQVRELDARRLYIYDRIQDVGGIRRLAFHPSGSPVACSGSLPKGGALIMGTPAVLTFNWPDGRLLNTRLIGSDTDGFVEDLAWVADGILAGVISGHPGNGRLFLLRPGEDAPFFTAALANGRSLGADPGGTRMVAAATQAVSPAIATGTKNKTDYPDNASVLHIWELAATA